MDDSAQRLLLHERLLLAARFSQAAYGIVSDVSKRQYGLDKAKWQELGKLPKEQRAPHATSAIGPTGSTVSTALSRTLDDGNIGIVHAVVSILEAEDAELVGHFRNSMNGAASIWLLPARKMVLLAWKGSQSAGDYVQDGKIARHEWVPNKRSEPSPSGLQGLGARWSFARVLNFRDVAIGGIPLPVPCFDDMEANCYMIHRGFLEQYEHSATDGDGGVGESVNCAVGALLQDHPGFGLLVTGHSLGGALAHLSAFELASSHPAVACHLITFGCPRVGNARFAGALDMLPSLTTHRVQNMLDPICHGPSVGYRHAGLHVWLRDDEIDLLVASTLGDAHCPRAGLGKLNVSGGKFHTLAGPSGYLEQLEQKAAFNRLPPSMRTGLLEGRAHGTAAPEVL